ncbi:RHS repeat-associated core domain-containing protein [Kutzneria chonburiensis]|uniref:RHS repeat-associated core domain-containing protein n=1 Tax=Kutzneria chonburiensis TaxID=1483604 RepID=A0ABV6N5R2_9PSEU
MFGLNHLPGVTPDDPKSTATNSVWTEPVYATTSGQPCYNANFSASHCMQAYRWNLDYVKDTHNDVVSFFYNTESNNYAADLADQANSSYIRGGYLTKIQYGQRDGQVYTTLPAAQVMFTSTGRCKGFTCDPSKDLTSATADNWPDVPYDLNCAAGTSCDVKGPAFWSNYTLQSIETDVLVGTTETKTDTWSLGHDFPATGDSTKPAVWLSSITHTGQDTTAGGSTTPITLPPVTFTGTPLANRVNLNTNSPITRQRLTTVTTETGEVITVGYSTPGCASSVPASPDANTSLCYPAYWLASPSQGTPTMDWFNKFIVTAVTEDDPLDNTSGQNAIRTTYTPMGTPAWTRNNSPLTPNDRRTYDQWRGYQGMVVTKGTSPQTKTASTYYRGIAGETPPKPAGVSAVRTATPKADAEQYQGVTYETVTYNGNDIVSDTINDPWTSDALATHALTGLPSQQAFLTGTADTKVFTPMTDGSVRETETDNTHDNYGRVTKVNDQGDVSTTADDLCTTTAYDDNPGLSILDKPSEVSTVSVNCAATATLPDDAVSDMLTFYDGAQSITTPPSVGDVSMSQQIASYTNGVADTPVTLSTTATDQYGRPIKSVDGNGNEATTAYTPTTGATPTSLSTIDAMGLTTGVTFDPLRSLPLVKTDTAGYKTRLQYDALGRLTTVFKPGMADAALKYTYAVSNTGPSVVDTYSLKFRNGYKLSETLYDGMLRARETQTETPNGRLVTDTEYNNTGLVSVSTAPYFNASPVSTSYVRAAPDVVPSATGFVYDGVGRKTQAIANANGSQTWQTTYVYDGNSTTTIPPAGAPATTTIVDARGHTTDLFTYHSGVSPNPADPPADYSATHYTYYPNGKQHTIVDAAGNSWSYQYNVRGQQTSATDPDAGTSVSTYDNGGRLATQTDSRGKQITFAYDRDSRKIGTFDTTSTKTTSTANQIAGWTYDAAKKGYPDSTTSYSGGDVYTQTIRVYNQFGTPGAITTTLTGEPTGLVPATGGLTTGYSFNSNGFPTDVNYPAVDGLPSEDVQTDYDDFGEPNYLKANVTNGSPGNGATWLLVKALGYSNYGEPKAYTLTGATGDVMVTDDYDPQTHALTDVTATVPFAPTVDHLTYTYSGAGVSKGAGLLTSTQDVQNSATTDTQCFAYDYATRLAGAWTATDNCSVNPVPGNSATVGGPNPYWQSWTYDAAGNRATQVDHNTTGDQTKDTTTTYNYPTQSSATDQPHTLSNTTATGPNAAANTATYHYDTAGNTTQISGGPIGDQSLTWNNQGKLANDTTATGGSAYVYDADGNLIVRHDPGKVTFFYGNQELTLDTTTHTATGSRYYAIGGTTIAMRTSNVSSGNPQFLVPDRQGTDQLLINSGTYQVTRRQFMPFGSVRGVASVSWPGSLGYVGGTQDPATQLENLGAREYNPAVGRFLSVDPVLGANDPNQLNGYDYAGNNPVTGSDPSGLWCDGCNDGKGWDTPNGYFVGKIGDDGHPQIDLTKNPPVSPRQWSLFNALGDEGKLKMLDPIPGWHPAECHSTACAIVGGILTTGICEFATAGVATPLCLAAGGAVSSNVTGDNPIMGAATAVAGGVVADAVAPVLAPLVNKLASAVASKLGSAARPALKALGNLFKAACANSFAADTQVLMADGSSKPIQNVKVGDKIANATPNSAAVQNHTVTGVHVTDTDTDFTSLSVATADGPKTITVTAHHLFWDGTNHSWTNASDLKPGDGLDAAGGATVLSVWRFISSIRTYDLTVDDLHTYYVLAGTTAVLVHNDGESDPEIFSNLYPEDTTGWTRLADPGLLARRTGNWQYVVLTDGTLLIGKGDGHIALTKGADVRAAGEVRVKSGRITEVNNLSGHYKPYGSNAESAAVEAFNEAGLDATGKYVEHVFPRPPAC